MVARLTKEQLNYFENPDFYQDYMEMFIFRLTFSNMSIERDLGEIADSKNAIRLRDNYRAFQKLLTMFSYDMSEDLIIDIANTINKSSMYISNGYRKLGRTLGDTNEPISDPKDIKSDMEKLLYNYYNEWNNLDPYLREAKFNIEFLRIHPFEDGNGRTSRLLLNFNLMKQKIAPVIITDDLVDDYFKARNNFDEEWIANMFRVQSEKELEVIDGLTKELKKIIEEREVDVLVLGLPKNMNGTIGERGETTIKFKEKLEKELNKKVILEDERLTTRIAENILIKSDISRKKRKKVIDKMSATVILQSYLDKVKRE